MANRLRLFRNGAVGFIDWLDLFLIFVNKGVDVAAQMSYRAHQGWAEFASRIINANHGTM